MGSRFAGVVQGSGAAENAGQLGAVLLVNLVYLVVLAFIALVVIETASLQFRMAGNFQSQEVAMQMARGIALELARSHEFDTQVPVGHRVCALGAPDIYCDERSLPEPGMLRVAGFSDAVGVDEATYVIERRYPPDVSIVVQGVGANGISSSRREYFAIYEIDVSVSGQGQSRTVLGVALRLPDGLNDLDGDVESDDEEEYSRYNLYWREPALDPL